MAIIHESLLFMLKRMSDALLEGCLTCNRDGGIPNQFMFYVQESKGLGSTGNKSIYRFLFCHTTKFPKFPRFFQALNFQRFRQGSSMMETSKSLGCQKKNRRRVSLGTELQPQH